jgi:hypothetical protein
MANSGYVVGVYSGRTSNDAILEVWRYTSNSANQSRWSWRLTARKFGATSYSLDPEPWSVNVEGDTWSGSHNLDFRNTSSIVIAQGTTGWKTHNADGYLTVNFSFSHGPVGLFGTASGSSSFSANRLPKPPDTPPLPVYNSRTPTSLTFTIAQPADNGGSAITTYNMVVYDAATGGNLVQSWSSGSSSQTTPGTLDSNRDYWVAYRAVNAIGASAYTARVKMTTAAGKPGPPLNPVAQDLAPTSFDLVWQAPASNGGAAITGYTVQRARDAAFTLDSTSFSAGTALTYAFDDLAPSTDYWFRISATNSAGTGDWSEAVQVTTVSGVYYSDGSTWRPCGVFVSDGTNWIPVELAVSNGTTWITAS